MLVIAGAFGFIYYVGEMTVVDVILEFTKLSIFGEISVYFLFFWVFLAA